MEGVEELNVGKENDSFFDGNGTEKFVVTLYFENAHENSREKELEVMAGRKPSPIRRESSVEINSRAIYSNYPCSDLVSYSITQRKLLRIL